MSDAALPAPDPGGPVTVVVSRRVRRGREPGYEAWLAGVLGAAKQFPGHLGANVVRPAHSGGDYVLIFRFDNEAHLLAWERSPERAHWLAQVEPLVEGDVQRERISGLEFWFTPPAGSAHAPPRWKMAVVLALVIWPLSTALARVLAPWLEPVPWWLRGAPVVAVMVPLMTWVVMPQVLRLLAGWLYPPAR